MKTRLRDAKRKLMLNITNTHIRRARKAKQNALPAQQYCVLAQSGKTMTNVWGWGKVIAVNFERNFCRIWIQSKRGAVTVYRFSYTNGVDSSARDVAWGWDKFNGAQPGQVTLYPPKGVRTLAYTRSPEFKEKRRESQERSLQRRLKGIPPKGYRRPHGDLLRWGLGQHDNIA